MFERMMQMKGPLPGPGFEPLNPSFPSPVAARATLPRHFRPLRQNALCCLDILDERSSFNQFTVLCSAFRDKDGDRKSRRDKRRGSLCLSEIISASAGCNQISEGQSLQYIMSSM